MRAIGFNDGPSARGGLRRLRAPALVLIAVAVAALLVPAVHAVLTVLIWTSWSLVAALALRAVGLRVPTRVRELGPVLHGQLDRIHHQVRAFLPGETARDRSGARRTQTASTS
ncbi:hypothetical protein [Pseudonocardia sp. KRD291]|uniref:hypothetical protein n=1 Tax=Pseudonocardia sp. KRD291 TaxID=2792007 RepID=UPI001C4A13EE|nr:hypothetical protein [Pseudonocardia sp. KRD291]MBW0105796.1 hypothetical protein [Pseudonocardia sp. KRD291]